MTDIIFQLCNITVHSFQVHGHCSFLSLSFSLGQLTESNYSPLYVGLHPTVVSTSLTPSGRACLGVPAHHACSTYVLSLHPRFNLWSRLLPSTSTKVASAIVSCDLQSRLWMRLYSGLPIAELTRNSLTDTWNRGTRGTEGHEEHEKDEEHEDTRGSQNEINAMATLHRYKRGHAPRIRKGLKRPTLAWNKTKCSLLQLHSSVCLSDSLLHLVVLPSNQNHLLPFEYS